MSRVALLLALLLGGEELSGPMEFRGDGVKIGQKVTSWKKISTLEESDPVPAAPEDPFGDEEGKALLKKIVENAFDKAAIQGIGPRIAKRAPKAVLSPPFEGRWLAAEDKTRHHQLKAFALYALDMMKVDPQGRMFQGAGENLSDHYSWGEPIHAAGDGEVIQVDDHFDDLPAMKIGKFAEANYVAIRHPGGESTFYGHIKKGSAKVKVGETVKKGQPIANVGNSGASTIPHCHFALLMPVQDDQNRAGWISVPFRFQGFRLVQAGKTACDIQVRQARPQEGWILMCPKPE